MFGRILSLQCRAKLDVTGDVSTTLAPPAQSRTNNNNLKMLLTWTSLYTIRVKQMLRIVKNNHPIHPVQTETTILT
jgi:hypothetical protein